MKPTINGFECCSFCWQRFGDEGNYSEHSGIGMGINMGYGPVVHAKTGNKLGKVIDTDPSTPIAHVECWKEYAGGLRTEDRKLGEWSQ